MFSRNVRFGGRRQDKPAQHRRRSSRPSLESLEIRELMTLGSEFLGPVNLTTRNAQFDSDNATSAGGSSVVVWTDTYSSSDRDIRAQRYNSFGTKLGPELIISGSGLDESSPAVAMDDQGRFVVTWVQKLSSGDTNVVARSYDSNGNPVGNVVQVGAGTFKESDPDVAMDRLGNYVVSYTRETNNNNPDIFAKRYNNTGQLLQVVDVSIAPQADTHSSVAMTPDGRFAVAWEFAFSTSDHDIRMSRYTAGGSLIELAGVATSTRNDVMPSISMDDNGNGVVAWEKAGDIKAMRFTQQNVSGIELNIASSSASETKPAVAIRRGGGGFVVGYDSYSSGTTRTKVAEVSSSNSVTTLDAGIRYGAAVSIDAFGNYLLTYTAFESNDNNIKGRRGALRF